MTPSSRYSLRPTRSHARRVDALARRLPRVGLDGVRADADRVAVPCAVPGAAAGAGLAWDARDQADEAWWPQGVAVLGSGDVVLVSWYARRRAPGSMGGAARAARLSVVDRTAPGGPRYRHVLLARAWPGPGASLRSVPVHAGGIAVIGDLLYVADTISGVRVFRLGDVLRVPARGRPGGHRYVLPQLLRLRVPLPATGRLRFSFLSVADVDGRPGLVAGEYRRQGGAPRLVRYRIDPATGLPEPGPDGRCAPVEVHEDQPPRMQGVALHGRTWYLSASAGAGRAGDLHVGAPGSFTRHRGVLPPAPEDLDWSRPGEELWSVTEGPGQRWVYPLDATRWRGPRP